jgi:predicted  nucleic acid-binding Zn-ribbon protein
MWNDINWSTVLVAVIVALISASGGVLVAKLNRKSQAEANNLTSNGQFFTQQNTLLQDVQEERDKKALELKEEREQNKRDIANLNERFEAFKVSVQTQFSGYRKYIHGLRGQVHDLGGVPIEWPPDLEQ